MTIAVDFDGVLFNGDEPIEGAHDAIRELSKRYRLVVHTARHDLAGVQFRLAHHRMGHHFYDVTNRKPAAVAYLDDRAVRFVDWDQAVKAIEDLHFK
jgi:hypothetical protein